MTQINTTKRQAREIDLNAWRIKRKQEQSHRDVVNRRVSENRHQPLVRAH
jgi:hypothetical protein